MISGVWLDTAIGVVLFFLVMSFIATAAVEAVAQATGWRARTLRKGIANLLDSVGLGDGKTTDENPWLSALYQHSLMRGLYAKDGWAFYSGSQPSYVPPMVFAGALLDLVTINGPLGELKAARREWDSVCAATTALDDGTRKKLTERFDRLGAALVSAAAEVPAALTRETERVEARLSALDRQATSADTASNAELAAYVQRMTELAKRVRSRLTGDLKDLSDDLRKFDFPSFVPRVADRIAAANSIDDINRQALVVSSECDRVAELLAWITSDTDRALGAGASVVDKIAVPELRDALKSLATGAQSGIDDARLAVASWFDGSMQRVEGWYKRRTQLCSFGVGLAVAMALNADAINVISTIATTDKLRSELVVLSEKVAAADKERLDFLRDQIAVLPVGWYRTACFVRAAPIERGDPPRPCTLNDSGAILTPLQSQIWKPVGEMVTWREAFSPDVRLNWSLMSPFGWLLTALAVMLGAPFWFDLLSKLVRMRATGKTVDAPAAQTAQTGSTSTPK